MSIEEEEEDICSHVKETKLLNPNGGSSIFSRGCSICESEGGEDEGETSQEFHVCCTCGQVLCSKNEHVKTHFRKNESHFIILSLDSLEFFCNKCEKKVDDESLKSIFHRMHYNKYKKYTNGYNVNCFNLTKEQPDFEAFQKLISEEFVYFTPLVESIDMVSKRCALRNLQSCLRDVFGRKVGEYDGHGVHNYTLKRTVNDLSSEKEEMFEITPKLKIPTERLIREANSFRVYYLEEFTSKEMIRKHFVDKNNSRFWNLVFEKHFYISTSNILVLYDHQGLELPKEKIEEQKNKIVMVTAVGFDCSANRHLGVHFGDFLSILERNDGKDVFDVLHNKKIEQEKDEKKNKEKKKKKKKKKIGISNIWNWITGSNSEVEEKKKKESTPPIQKEEEEEEEEEGEGIVDDDDEKKKSRRKKDNIRRTELWDDSYGYWMSLDRNPKSKYKLNREKLKKMYKMIFSLVFHALEKEQVEMPVICALGCGVFGRCYYCQYHETVFEAYLETLAQKNDYYGFKGLILCEVSPRNLEVFKPILREFVANNNNNKNLPPILICQNDILGVIRMVSKHHSCSCLNAGDLWEFGQYWEGGAALEEYLARMTTGYFSQHFMMNPKNVLNFDNYIPVKVRETGCKENVITEKDILDLQNFIQKIKNEFF